MKGPSFEVFCEWIVNAYDKLSCDLIKKSFFVTGISNATDGSEDYLISCFKRKDYQHGLELFARSHSQLLPQTEDELCVISNDINDNEVYA